MCRQLQGKIYIFYVGLTFVSKRLNKANVKVSNDQEKKSS